MRRSERRVTQRVENRAAQQIPVSAVDGFARSVEAEKRLNELFAAKFSDPAGQEILTYLRSISINHIQGPAVDDGELRHIEGQRYHQAIIERRIDLGRKRK